MEPGAVPRPHRVPDWAESQDIHVTLNIHASIADQRPAATARPRTIAGQPDAEQLLAAAAARCWDWSNVAQAESYFATARSRSQNRASASGGSTGAATPATCSHARRHPRHAGSTTCTPRTWSTTASAASSCPGSALAPGLAGRLVPGRPVGGPPLDDRLHRRHLGHLEHARLRGAAGRRTRAASASPTSATTSAASSAPPPATGNDPDDLYLRWLQLGTFQPIMREHSNSGQNAGCRGSTTPRPRPSATQFLQLREELVPYTYTLAAAGVAAPACR